MGYGCCLLMHDRLYSVHLGKLMFKNSKISFYLELLVALEYGFKLNPNVVKKLNKQSVVMGRKKRLY